MQKKKVVLIVNGLNIVKNLILNERGEILKMLNEEKLYKIYQYVKNKEDFL